MKKLFVTIEVKLFNYVIINVFVILWIKWWRVKCHIFKVYEELNFQHKKKDSPIENIYFFILIFKLNFNKKLYLNINLKYNLYVNVIYN